MSESIEILIAKHLSENISEEEQSRLDAWLKADHINIEEFERLKKIWDHSLNLSRESAVNIDESWEEFKLLRESQFKPEVKTRKFSQLKIAAAIALLISTILLLKLYIPKITNTVPEHQLSIVPQKIAPKIPETKPLMITVSTGDSIKEFLLPDSSRVYLYKNSQLIYAAAFDKNERVVVLKGEAFFDVKHDAVPFTAYCQNAKIRDLGTSFNIKGYEKDNEVEVIVVTGKVELSDKENLSSKKIILSENEWGTFNKEQRVISKPASVKKDLKKRQKTSFIQKIKNLIKKLRKKKK